MAPIINYDVEYVCKLEVKVIVIPTYFLFRLAKSMVPIGSVSNVRVSLLKGRHWIQRQPVDQQFQLFLFRPLSENQLRHRDGRHS